MMSDNLSARIEDGASDVVKKIPINTEIDIPDFNNETGQSVERAVNQNVLQLPTEQILPTEWQQKSLTRKELIVEELKNLSQMEQRIYAYDDVVRGIDDSYEQVLNAHPDSEYVREEVNKIVGQIRKELATIDEARRRLNKGQDVGSFLGMYEPDSSQLYDFGTARSIKQLIHQMRIKVSDPNYVTRRNERKNNQKRYLDSKAKLLPSMVNLLISFSTIRPSTPSMEQLDISNDDFESFLQKLGYEALEKHKNNRAILQDCINKRAVLSEIRKWVDVNLPQQNNPDEVKAIIDMNEAILKEPSQGIMRWLESLKTRGMNYRVQIDSEIDEFSNRMMEEMANHEFSIPDGDWSTLNGNHNSLHFCGVSSEEFIQLREMQKWHEDYLSKNNLADNPRKDNLKRLIGILTDLSTLNKSFPDKQELLWHVHFGKDDDVMYKIIESGVLASRAARMERFGEATFNSEGISVKKQEDGRYYVRTPRVAEVVTKDELRTLTGWANRDWFQEYNQSCFTMGKPYSRKNDVHSGFCFSASSLLTDRQFMTYDGWHVFDKDYKGNPESAGFEINFQEEPFFFVVSNDRKKWMKEQIIRTLGSQTIWNEDVDAWMEQHVIAEESLSDEACLRDVNNKFFERYDIKGKPGYFMPSGVTTDAISDQRKRVPLITFKSV